MDSVLVLNASYEPLHKVSVNHAIKMIVREVAVIEKAKDGETFGEFPVPIVLRLVKYVKMAWRKTSPKYSKARLFQRDKGVCGYCGKAANTVEHIVPRSMGGKTVWSNVILSCLKCNHKKGNKTLEQSGMRLLFTPYEPSWYDLA